LFYSLAFIVMSQWLHLVHRERQCLATWRKECANYVSLVVLSFTELCLLQSACFICMQRNEYI